MIRWEQTAHGPPGAPAGRRQGRRARPLALARTFRGMARAHGFEGSTLHNPPGEDPSRKAQDAVRLTDVAREAGVAIATASRALSNPSRVNAKTRVRVLAAAERLGYTTNIAARSLRSGLSRIVLVVMPPWEGFSVLESVIHGVDEELMRSGYSMVVGTLSRDRSADPRIIEMARGGFVDGILAVTNEAPREGGGPHIISAHLPSVGLLIDLSDFGVPSVVVAEREGIRLLTEHLLARGRRKLAFVGGMPGYHDVERLAGFEDAVRAASCPLSTLHLEGDYSAAAGARAAELFLNMAERPDGIVFTNDWMAIAFIDAVTRAGVRVPDDVSVVGFDGIEAARFIKPPLTTYAQPMQRMGVAAARQLLDLIAGEAVKEGRTIFPGELVIRGSS